MEGESQAFQERPHKKFILWMDHSNYKFSGDEYYCAKLSMIIWEDNTRTLELSSGGTVTRTPYQFPFMEKDRL